MKLSIREWQLQDVDRIIDYFTLSDAGFLKGMGADKSKIPNRKEWREKLEPELDKPYTQKENYYMIWVLNNVSIGHSNINNIKFGESATMHLHLWKTNQRKNGLGVEFIKLTIPSYFENFKLKKIICEPYAANIAPNKTLKKIGFNLVKTYNTIPGFINFYQTVNRYELTKEQFLLCG